MAEPYYWASNNLSYASGARLKVDVSFFAGTPLMVD